MEGVHGGQAFERLLDEYRDKVFRLACSLLGDEAAAEDATQDIFLKIWKALPGFRGDSSLSTWIYAVARNTCLTRRRAEKLRRTFGLDDVPPSKLPVALPASSDAGLRAQIDRLPLKYRSVLVLFYLEDRSYEQVSAALGLPMGTVKTYLHRAKKELALLLSGQAVRKEEAIVWRAANSKI